MYPDLIVPIIQLNNQMSQGVMITREITFPKCRGKFIAFLEGDDYWANDDRLQMQVDAMLNNPNVFLCVGKTQYIDCRTNDTTIVVPLDSFAFKPGIIPPDYYNRRIWVDGAYFHTSSFLMKREVLVAHFNCKFGTFSNGDQAWLRMASVLGEIFFFDELFSYRRIMADNSWNKWYHDASSEIRNKWLFKRALGALYFDLETDKQYHKYVCVDLIRTCYLIVENYRKDITQTPSSSRRRSSVVKLPSHST